MAIAISLLYLWKGKAWGTDGGIMLGFAYACMFTALYIDFAKIRPYQKAVRKGQLPPGRADSPAPKKKLEDAGAEKPASGKAKTAVPDKESEPKGSGDERT